jgi:integrase
MTTPATARHLADQSSPFAGADVCGHAGLALPDGAGRPVFDHDLWDFTDVIGLPVQMPRYQRRFDFTAITHPRWRLVAKELVLAMLAPQHPAVALLPRAYRTPLHLRSCAIRLDELSRLFTWLGQQGITSLTQLDTTDCEAYLAHRRFVLDQNGAVAGEQSPGVRRSAAQAVIDLISYRDLFTADRVRPGLLPWGGVSATAVAQMPSGRDGNKTAPVPGEILQPMLAAALHLVTVLGPHAVELQQQIREADRASSLKAEGLRHGGPDAIEDIKGVLAGYTASGTALPMIEDHDIGPRLAAGWPPGDPLLPVATGILARQAGYTQLWASWMPLLRGPLQDAVNAVGVDRRFARNPAEVPAANGSGMLPWTLPLHRSQAVALIGIVRTAAIVLLAAVSGMRASELMELRVGCRRPAEEPVPGFRRFRLASKIVKGQPLGGTDDEWVVIEPAYWAVELAERLHEDPQPGAPLFGRFAFYVRYKWFRAWVNSDAGRRLGLDPIPGGLVNPRMLRRALALEMAYRPGGVLATKIHLKHVAVATTEGYTSRPGGAQAELLAEVNKHETERNLELVLAEFRSYQQGILPAGPGARELTEFFALVDEKLEPGAATAPRVQRNDRDILNLLSKRAKVLHLAPANYCWFTDPSRALCLRLAGTATAERPLTGMCDSARCPQATHHPCHRPVWAEHAENTKTFLGQLGPARKTEKARLQAEYDRAARVLARIDEAAAAGEPG